MKEVKGSIASLLLVDKILNSEAKRGVTLVKDGRPPGGGPTGAYCRVYEAKSNLLGLVLIRIWFDHRLGIGSIKFLRKKEGDKAIEIREGSLGVRKDTYEANVSPVRRQGLAETD